MDNTNENNIILDTTLFAKDIREISVFNFYPAVGITFGVRHFRANFSNNMELITHVKI